MKYTLPELGYDYSSLEPHFDAATMEIHHTKHHNTYIANLNNALEGAGYEGPESVEVLIADLNAVPEAIRGAVRNNAGGHANHSFFWKLLSKDAGNEPSGPLADAINDQLGSMDAFKDAFKKAALTRFGSGWAWLCVKSDKTLCVCSTPNQDSPLMAGVVDCPGTPVIGLDVWEHAYYLNYQNKRPDYVDAFWNVLNWDVANKNYEAAMA